ncbi:MAG: enoyl-ACP reductase [Armatimonadetes bacterium]|nr:enoyl-ACP reductase [Armatimonadota bacterium]
MLLEGKKGLVLNVTNKHSIGWAVAEAANRHGARVGVGAQNEKLKGKVEELIEGRPNFDTFMVDFAFDDQLEALRDEVAAKYGMVDFVIHSAAYAKREDLAGRFIETSRDGFQLAMDVSAYSLVALCRALEPVIADDASVMAMSYLGSTRAVPGYNVMGVAKAALESSVRYLAGDLGVRGIRVNTVSPGPINTVAARGVRGLTEMIETVHERSPLKRPFGQEEVAGTCVYLISDLSRGVTGQIVFVDDGYNTIGI